MGLLSKRALSGSAHDRGAPLTSIKGNLSSDLATGRELTPTVRARQVRLEEPQVDELVAARADGAMIAELAHRFGVHRHTVSAHLRRRSAVPPTSS